MIAEVEVDSFLEHHGVKGMKWGVRKSLPLSEQSNRIKKRTARQQKQVDRLKRVSSGKSSVSDKLLTTGLLFSQARASKRLSRLQTQQDKILAGKRKTADIINRAYGINVRYLNYKS